MNLRHLILLFVIFVASSIGLFRRTAPAQDQEVVAGGEIEYQHYCATCHGVNGKGGGPMARFLTIEPSDLTLLAKKNGNKFDFWQVYRTIDGREQVRGHGTREMPVWGTRFQAEAEGYDQVQDRRWQGGFSGWFFISSTSKGNERSRAGILSSDCLGSNLFWSGPGSTCILTRTFRDLANAFGFSFAYSGNNKIAAEGLATFFRASMS